MSSPAHLVLRTVFGHDAFWADQERIIDRAMSGQHSLVLMPTGMGKSLCYQVPAIVMGREAGEEASRRSLTLVLSPLIALMKDQVDALVARGVSATFINSSLDRQTRERRCTLSAHGLVFG